MGISQKIIGAGLVLASITIFIYYSLWIFLIPFVEKGNPILQWFLDPEYAITIPATLLVLGIAFISIFVSYVFIKESQKRKSQ